jgi:nitrite reductase/ring-hydroxylating ferredoxin subunit
MRVRVSTVDELEPGMATRVTVNGTAVAVFNIEGSFYAIGDTCTHEEASLSDGFIDEDTVECPKHGAVFHIPTGEVRTLPATRNEPVFRTVVDGNELFVEDQDG